MLQCQQVILQISALRAKNKRKENGPFIVLYQVKDGKWTLQDKCLLSHKHRGSKKIAVTTSVTNFEGTMDQSQSIPMYWGRVMTPILVTI